MSKKHHYSSVDDALRAIARGEVDEGSTIYILGRAKHVIRSPLDGELVMYAPPHPHDANYRHRVEQFHRSFERRRGAIYTRCRA